MGDFIRWDRITAILGGRFDPPHAGHVQAAKGLLRNPRVARVLVIPAAAPAHKPARASAEDRLAMTRLAFSEFEVSDLEVRRAESTGLPTYSFDTLNELRKQTQDLAFALGTDQFSGIQSWHRFPEVLELCHWIILLRKGSTHAQDEAKVHAVLSQLESQGLVRKNPKEKSAYVTTNTQRVIQITATDAVALSSSQIREKIQMGEKVERDLDPAVFERIAEKRLYGYRA
ncbi:MAG: nicotinate (nicotinamide) nucleotide adenylyltransferase [Bdellovibrionales bacterium]|nr:nicotinate (nicotinamide) nucleotide adenylyltransferase [Bdellovibrionales bacterium]